MFWMVCKIKKKKRGKVFLKRRVGVCRIMGGDVGEKRMWVM